MPVSLYPGSIPRVLNEKIGEVPSVFDFGARGDGRILTDGTITAGSHSFSSASGTLTPNDVGSTIWIEGAGAAGIDLLTTISSYVSSTNVHITTAASTTVTGALTRYGTDDTAALQAAHNQVAGFQGDLGLLLKYPRGRFLTTDTILLGHNLCIRGEGFSYHVYGTQSPSLVMCCANKPVFSWTDTSNDGLRSCTIAGLSFNGTRRSGSKGIYTAKATGLMLRDCTFNWFGDQAVHLDGGVFDNHLFNLHVVGSCLVRARSSWVGCIDVAQTDLMIEHCMASASCSHDGVNPVPAVSGAYGNGFIAAFNIRQGNCWISNCMGHHAQVGWHVDTSSDNTFVNCRADDNQGHGWVIDGAFSHYLGCRAFADGQDADGTYDAFLVNGNGNDFNFCQVNNFGYGGSPPSPLYNRYKHAFETMNANTTEPNRFMNERVATYACTSDVFKFSGSQVNNPNFDLTAFDPIGRRTARFRCDLSVWDDAYTHVKTTGPSNEKVWETRLNYGSGFSELVHGVLSDDYLTEVLYMFVLRLGTVIKNIQFQNADKMTVSGMPLNTDTITISASHLLQFLATTGIVLAGSGSPEGVVSAVGGSLYLDGNGHLYIKVAGTGNTGWSLAVTAADVLVVTQGGTGVNTLTANGVVIGEGTSPVHATGAGTAGQVLTSNGAGVDPSFQALPAGPTVDVNSELTAQASGNLTCTTSYADISGLSVTLNKNGVWRIEASLDLSFDSSAFQMSAQLVVNGVAQTGIILAIISSAGATTLSFEGLFTRSWYYTNSGSNVAKMQAKSAVASGSRSVIAANSYMSAVFLHS